MDYEYIYIIVEENSEQDALLLSQYDKDNMDDSSFCGTETIILTDKFTGEVTKSTNRIFRFNLLFHEVAKSLLMNCKENPLISLNHKIELDLEKIRFEMRICHKFNI